MLTEHLIKKPSEMNLEEFNLMLAEEPKPETVFKSDDPDSDGNFFYHIPIAFLEEDLRLCFDGLVQFQKTPNAEIFNSLSCDAMVGVWHPVLKQWLWYHGTSAVMIEQVSQGRYADTTKVVKANDESMAAGLAYAEAIKSAARKIGNRFGANLNRRNAPGKQKTAFEVMPKPVFDPAAKYTKKEMLQFVNQQVLTADQMNDYLAGKEVIISDQFALGCIYEEGVNETIETPKTKKSKK